MRLINLMFMTMFIVSGCQNDSGHLLDTSKLEKEKVDGNITEEQLKSIPAVYKAPSVEVALEAIPFNLQLPTELPFKTDGFERIEIQDWHDREDKQDISIGLEAWDAEKTGQKMIGILVHDFKVSYHPSGIKLSLNDGTEARYDTDHKNSGSINFVKDGLYISISYTNRDEKFDNEKMRETLINLANQM